MKKKVPGMPSKKEMEDHDKWQTEREDNRVKEHNKGSWVKKSKQKKK